MAVVGFVQFGHAQLPHEVGFQGGFLGVEAFKGQGLPFFVLTHGGRHEPVFQKAIPIPFFHGGLGIAVPRGRLRGRLAVGGEIRDRGLLLAGLRLFKLLLLQDRVGLQDLLDFAHQLQLGQLQQLDGLLQLLGHDERLG